jgi:hypothetical protein
VLARSSDWTGIPGKHAVSTHPDGIFHLCSFDYPMVTISLSLPVFTHLHASVVKTYRTSNYRCAFLSKFFLRRECGISEQATGRQETSQDS